MRITAFLFALAIQFAWSGPVAAQTVEIRGRIVDKESRSGLPDAIVAAGDMAVAAGADGAFSIRINPLVDTVLRFDVADHEQVVLTVTPGSGPVWQLGEIQMARKDGARPLQQVLQDIPVIELTENDFDDNATGNVSALLQASRDPFFRAAAFQFSAARFRIRGYESRYTTAVLNGVLANDAQNGDVSWSDWAGLNDVMRPQENQVGLVFAGEAMANMGGLTMFDTRAHRQRKQIRVSYSNANRTYTNRLMATWSTGWLRNGWALSASGSRRWAQEGYVPGTFFDGWSYFLSVDKRLGEDHILNLTVLGAPTRRGRSVGNTHEQNDIAGTNYYNPYWGYQDGRKRNSRALNTHQPLAILRYDWKMGRDANLTASVSYQDGRYGVSALDWNEARDPRAEYYRRWPSSSEDPLVAEQMRAALEADESLRQVDWTYMYEVNRNSPFTVLDANGISGNTVTGLRSKYILQEFRSDSRTLQGRAVYQQSLGGRHLFSAGIQGQQQSTHFFQHALDLLGGDFWLDVNRFAAFDFPNDPGILQNDIETPNRIIGVGDRYGYDYLIHARNAQGWAQIFLSGARLDGFLGAEIGYADFWREGLVANGRFPQTSKGNSEVLDFMTWKAKGGLTYKFDGRNYLSGAVFASQNAPDYQNGFISPRSRNDVVADLPAEKVISGELGYRLQAPRFKFSATGYLTEIRDQVNVITFFNDLANTFGNYVLTDIHRRHIGTEWGLDWKVTPAWELNGAVAMGRHYFTDRALATVTEDNTGEPVYTDRTVYIRNFRLDGMPQEAFSLGLTYNSRKFWFANIQANYFRKAYLDFSPDRRTAAAVDGVEQGSEQWNAILDQEELPGGFMLNVFGGKSWKVKNTFVYLNVGINNVLNNRNLITGGFEQLRFDAESRDVSRFPNRYFYAFGTNYFINLSVRI